MDGSVSSETKKFLELEGLRGASAIVVFLCHWSVSLPRQDGLWAYFAAAMSPFGFIAVIVFFILSGFVIGHSAQSVPNGQAVKLYLQRRVPSLPDLFSRAYFQFLGCRYNVHRSIFFPARSIPSKYPHSDDNFQRSSLEPQ